MVPSLPFELIIKIIEYTYYRRAHRPDVDRRTLSACAMVCKQWSNFVRRLLFFRVNAVRPWVPWDETGPSNYLLPSSGGLAACIRSLHLQMDHRDPPELDFITAISHCPDLYELHLTAGNDTLELHEVEVTRLVGLSVRIRALRLAFFGSGTSHILHQFLAIWPSIQFLTLNVSEGCMALPREERPHLSLYELTLITPCSLPKSVIHWLLPPIPPGQRGSLHILSVGTAQLCNVPPEYALCLRSLRLPRPSPFQKQFIKHCSALQELIFEDVDELSRVVFFCQAIKLPRNIEHLKLAGGGTPDIAVACAFGAILTSDLPRLRQVSLGRRTAKQDQPLAMLRSLCDGKHVELVVEPHTYSRSELQYPVPVDRFPRDWTMENLYRMNVEG